jgi:hypothetical protein
MIPIAANLAEVMAISAFFQEFLRIVYSRNSENLKNLV